MSVERPQTGISSEGIKVTQENIVRSIEEGVRLAHEYFKDNVARKLSIELHQSLKPIFIRDGSDPTMLDEFRKTPGCYSVKEGKMFINIDPDNPRSLLNLLKKLAGPKDTERRTRVISIFIAIHEYTHHIQALNKQFEDLTFQELVRLEEQADYYAGKVLNYHSLFKNILSGQDEDAIFEFISLVGSDVDVEHIPGFIMDIKTEGGHGMGVIRKQNFFDGYTGVKSRLDF